MLCTYKIGWYWNNLRSTQLENTTWDETRCVPPASAVNKRPKSWDLEGRCFQKYCKVWNWYELSPTGKNPVRWRQTYRYGGFFKKWQYEANDTVCNYDDVAKETIDVTEQTVLKSFIVDVKEIMPIAVIYNETLPLTGYSPYTFKLSPIHCKTGSFPIDRIDWDPGDGGAVKTVSRYTAPDNTYFSYNNAYFNDPLDPRNYDFTYTIIRNSNTYPVFYPSLTCYSASTNSYDSCSITVGPVLLQPQTQNIQLLKAKNTTKGDFYGIEINKNITVLTTLTGANISKTTVPAQPKSPIKQLTNTTPVIYFGNTGENYPPLYIPTCKYTPSEADLLYLVREEDGETAITLEDTTLLYK